MKEWQIKEFSSLTQISIRMLRCYDKFGLLKPSYRMPNGYRCYTEQDLAKLQQIIALKFFGLKLATIKSILQQHHNIYAHLKTQQQVLRHQAERFQHVSNILTCILKRFSPEETPDFHQLINLIKGYCMIENMKEKFQKEHGGKLTEEQLQEMLYIYEHSQHKDLFKKESDAWEKWLEKINNDDVGDPSGPDGEKVCKLLNEWHQKEIKYTESLELEMRKHKLNISINKSISTGDIQPTSLTGKAHAWIMHAHYAVKLKKWNNLIDKINKNLDKDPETNFGKQIAQEWIGVINAYYDADTYLLIGIDLWKKTLKDEFMLSKLKKSPTSKEIANLDRDDKTTSLAHINQDIWPWIKGALRKHAGALIVDKTNCI